MPEASLPPDAPGFVSTKPGVARGALWAILTLAAFFAADAFLFRTGWYRELLEPDSSAGTLESALYWLNHTTPPKVPDVLVVGDSRIAEGFSARTAASTLNQRLHFRNFGVGGATPRVWYYTLRDADPERRRFAAIVLALDNYSDRDWWADFENRTTDQNYLVMRLGLGDCFDFALSLQDHSLRHRSLFGCIFRGMILRNDVQAFLAAPRTRIAHAGDWLAHGLGYTSDYTGMAENLRGLSVDWSTRTVHFPDGVSQTTRENVEKFVVPEPVAPRGEVARYRRRWLGAILDLYKDSPTRLIFLQLPRAPIVDPHAPAGPSPRFVETAAASPRVTVLPAETFTDFERPELFADGLHLNRDGRPLFSERLATTVETVLAGGSR